MAAPAQSERHILPGAARRIREAYGITAAALADKVGISAPYLCNIERGRKSPGLALTKRIAVALGVDLDDISYVVRPADDEAAESVA